jgi:hypothetical protein
MQWRIPIPTSGARVFSLLFLFGLWSLALAMAKDKKKDSANPPAVRATLQPVATIPVAPLGFSPPGDLYKGSRITQASLDFLDQDHLLFTFRIPGLMHRDSRSQPDASDERRIRAVVLRLPQGTIESETIWTVHDRARYLYMLDNGQYLLRDRDTLHVGEGSLQLKPFLHFPGKVLWVELDPTRQYIVTGSDEPPNRASKAGDVPSPASASAQVAAQDDDDPGSQPPSEIILRVLERSTGKVMLVSRVHTVVHVPLSATGYVEPIRGNGSHWTLNFDPFTGGGEPVGKVDSYCPPLVDFLSEKVFLVTACNSEGEPKLVALTTTGKRLWEAPPVGPSLWPVLVYSRDGARFARESLMATHQVNARAPLDAEDIKGQDVQIIDSSTGKIALRAAASPVLDAGGNVAIAPDDRRVVILMEGGLQVFELPPPPALPEIKSDPHPKE